MKQDKGELDEPRLDEYWVGFETFPDYRISNYGRVLNIRTGQELKPVVMENDYLYVKLVNTETGFIHNGPIHRLVAKAFFLNFDADRAVDFINGDKHDCTVLNLTLSQKRVRPGKNRDWN